MEIDKYNEKLISYLKDYNQKKDKNIVLLGGVGVGKTYLVKNLIDYDYFIDEATFKQELIAGNIRLNRPEEWGDMLTRLPLMNLIRRQFIIYDDYGTADITAAYIEKILFWINKRTEKGLKFIITTNLDLKSFKDRENRIASRLMESAIIIKLRGPDRRQKNSEILEF